MWTASTPPPPPPCLVSTAWGALSVQSRKQWQKRAWCLQTFVDTLNKKFAVKLQQGRTTAPPSAIFSKQRSRAIRNASVRSLLGTAVDRCQTPTYWQVTSCIVLALQHTAA